MAEETRPKKEGKLFKKGHPGYFAGKKIDTDKFIEGYNKYFSGRQITQAQFAEHIGVSIPTLMSRLKELYGTGRIEGRFFADGRAVVLDPSGMGQEDAAAWQAYLDRVDGKAGA